MKKIPFIFSFKSNFFKEQDPFHLVLVFFIIFFGTAIFFSVPTFYDYKKYNQQIENTINEEFKIQISKLNKISFKFIPSPHLFIKNAELRIGDNEKNEVSKLENIKVFISISEFYKNDKFEIKRIVVNKANLYLNNISLINFIKNLKKDIVNNFIIKKSTLFFKDKNDEIILISKINNFNYKVDHPNNKKILKINGNIFDSNYEFNYFIDYKKPNIQNINLELKYPNIQINSTLIEFSEKSIPNKKGILNINFLNDKNIINYELKKNELEFINQDLKNSNFEIGGLVSFNPFHFDLSFNLKTISLKDLENLIYTINQNQKLKYENLSGSLNIILENIENKIMNSGKINVFFQNSTTTLKNNIFKLNNFANLEIIDHKYLEDNNQILEMKIKLNILDKSKFNRFLFNFKKDKIFADNIFFIYRFDNLNNESYISKISNKSLKNNGELYKFKNLQQLKNLLKDEDIFILD